MKKKKTVNEGKFEFSASLAEVSTRGRIEAGFTQDAASAKTKVDKRTIMKMENGEGNPTLEKLYPVIRLYGVDPTPIFYPEAHSDTSSLKTLSLLLKTCSDKEAATLIPIVRAVLEALRVNAADNS